MERTAAIAELAGILACLMGSGKDAHGLDDEDINLAIRWAMIDRGIQDV